MRPSMDRSRKARPAYSTMCPVPPAVPIRPMIVRIRSLPVQPAGNGSSTSTRMFLGFEVRSVWVARTCSPSEVPMPKARAPKAPCVAVWLSQQTTVVPGRVKPCSGPMTCTMPWRGSSMSKIGTSNSRQLMLRVSTCRRDSGSSMPNRRSVVGTLWSATARVASRRRTCRPASRRPSNACGDSTSCSRCRSMYSIVVPSSCTSTTWLCQILSNRVWGLDTGSLLIAQRPGTARAAASSAPSRRPQSCRLSAWSGLCRQARSAGSLAGSHRSRRPPDRRSAGRC